MEKNFYEKDRHTIGVFQVLAVISLAFECIAALAIIIYIIFNASLFFSLGFVSILLLIAIIFVFTLSIVITLCMLDLLNYFDKVAIHLQKMDTQVRAITKKIKSTSVVEQTSASDDVTIE